ncbi:SDR family oxidoreductase [Streptacidiphilus sp. P02-A3a]|uniref:SDR family NAD(P)-dependent oxidoreductase n=1 Tax=Streptacidiphilus sp. P02-A3a TaxID=2704468 RepID=UPI0015FD716F|nr:SDR family NAD(P)-dependent oxidoreductase [Streptacidiphilus sp. P02-A3a]QMU68830.1 SDR family NAD(P)-dependent oxidoreductase [Streptacidiphilus sp. P02-A3a]
MLLAGSTVLLTGATGGIGRAVAAELASCGASLLLSGPDEAELAVLAGDFTARIHAADLADPAQVGRLAQAAAGVDVLVTCSGLPAFGDLLEYTPEQLDRSLAVNLRAPALLARLLAPAMLAAGRGHLVFVGSISGKAAHPGASLYNAAKFGLRGFALGLRQDLHGSGVGVSVVQPAAVADAGMFAASGATAPALLRTVSPARVAAAVVRAVERDRAELTVAPIELRLLLAVAGQFPGFAERVQRRTGAAQSFQQLAEAHRATR